MISKVVAGLGLGLGAAAIALLAGLVPFVRTIELKSYDWRMRATSDPARAREDIVIVGIDDRSIRALEPVVGRWPWPRLVHAQLLNFLARAKPRAVVYDILFTESDRTRFFVQDEEWTGEESDAALAEATERLGVVVHAADAAADTGTSAAIPSDLPGGSYRVAGSEPRPVWALPFASLLSASRAVGHNLVVLDPDGPLRRYVPFAAAGNVAVPALGIAGAVQALGVAPDQVRMGRNALYIGERRLPLVEDRVPDWDGGSRTVSRLLVSYPGVWPDGRQTYRTYSFYELFYAEQQLLAGEAPVVSPDAFDGRVVVVGATAAGLRDTFAVPLPGEMPGVEVHAAVIDGILSGRAIGRAPRWAAVACVLLAGMLAGLATVLGGAWTGTAVALVGAGGLVALTTWRFAAGEWLPLVTPLVALAVGTFGGLAYDYFVEGREKRRVKRLFSRYVSKDVYEELLRNPAGARLGGERRRMTVLFSDIRGFTSVSEVGAPEAIVAQLTEYFSRMVPIVFAHRGTIDKFVGDMIMALFGAPLDDPEHADHAVRAALAMSAELDRLNAEWKARGLPTFDIGVGINTGDMVAGNLGSEAIMSYTVIGDQVNLGSRLESLNKEFGTRILVTEATRAALRGRYHMRDLGDAVVKGRIAPVHIHAVLPSPAKGLNPEDGAADSLERAAPLL